MGKYLKMADVFDLPILGSRAEFFPLCLNESSAMIAAHAINNHDELVENMQHYKQEAEQWEARATKAASRAQDLEVEVERLRVIIDIKPMANRYNNDIDDFDNEIIMSGV